MEAKGDIMCNMTGKGVRPLLRALTRRIIVCGHYGSGKTTLALNLALYLREHGENVALADLDIVNPYFRTADFSVLMSGAGIRLIAPAYAGTSLDVPALTGELDGVLEEAGGTVIIDVGGDEDGARVLGRYSGRIAQGGYDMLFVANFYRSGTQSAGQAVEYIHSIEAASRLKITAVVNNSNLAGQTTCEDILSSAGRAAKLAHSCGKPLIFTNVGCQIAAESSGELTSLGSILPIKAYVIPPWG